MAEPKAQLAVVCLGIFAVMALSNAIVPVLPVFAGTSAWQGAMYAAYFFGAFISTLPGGLLADRYGTAPVIRAGLFLTVAAGALLFVSSSAIIIVLLRGCEGIGAGLFVASALAYINSRPDHTRMSGYYMAMLNLGLVLGLIITGWLAVHFASPVLGICIFTLCTSCALAGSVAFCKNRYIPEKKNILPVSSLHFLRRNLWLWYSAIVLVGITGVVSSLFPKFSGELADSISLWIAGMSIATIITVLLVSRFPLPPVPVIRWSALLMAGGVLLVFFTPVGFMILGALAGVVMIAQMAFLAQVPDHQGLLMGLFSTASYLGMALLPFVAGIIADLGGFFMAFFIAAFLGATVMIATIGKDTTTLS